MFKVSCVAGSALALLLSGCATTSMVPRIPTVQTVPKVPENNIQFFLNSEPQGATVLVDGRVIGVTPVRLNFGPLTPQHFVDKRLRTKPVTFTWKSGAQQNSNLTAVWVHNLKYVTATLTIPRPAVAGLAQDEAYAAQLILERKQAQLTQQTRLDEERRSQEASTADAVMTVLGAFLGGVAAYQAGKNEAGNGLSENRNFFPPPNRSITCRTQGTGDYFRTTCD